MLRFTEGFDWNTSTASMLSLGKWDDISGMAIGSIVASLRFGAGSGNYMVWQNNNHYLEKNFGANESEGVIGFAFRADTNATPTCNLLQIVDGATCQLLLRFNNDRTFSLYRGSTASLLGTSTFVATFNQYYYLELKWKIADSIGTNEVVLYADGGAILTLAAATDTKNTANAYGTKFRLCGNTPNAGSFTGNYYFDDLYWLDLTGAKLNAPLGTARIQTQFPNNNGATSNFIGSDGNNVNNYQQVDDPTLNVADFNDGAVVGDKDTYAFTDTVPTTNVIHAVVINHVSLRTDTDPRGVKPVVRHGGADYDGAEQALGASAQHFQQIYSENPGTVSGWTKSDVDAAEFGLKVSS